MRMRPAERRAFLLPNFDFGKITSGISLLRNARNEALLRQADMTESELEAVALGTADPRTQMAVSDPSQTGAGKARLKRGVTGSGWDKVRAFASFHAHDGRTIQVPVSQYQIRKQMRNAYNREKTQMGFGDDHRNSSGSLSRLPHGSAHPHTCSAGELCNLGMGGQVPAGGSTDEVNLNHLETASSACTITTGSSESTAPSVVEKRRAVAREIERTIKTLRDTVDAAKAKAAAAHTAGPKGGGDTDALGDCRREVDHAYGVRGAFDGTCRGDFEGDGCKLGGIRHPLPSSSAVIPSVPYGGRPIRPASAPRFPSSSIRAPAATPVPPSAPDSIVTESCPSCASCSATGCVLCRRSPGAPGASTPRRLPQRPRPRSAGGPRGMPPSLSPPPYMSSHPDQIPPHLPAPSFLFPVPAVPPPEAGLRQRPQTALPRSSQRLPIMPHPSPLSHRLSLSPGNQPFTGTLTPSMEVLHEDFDDGLGGGILGSSSSSSPHGRARQPLVGSLPSDPHACPRPNFAFPAQAFGDTTHGAEREKLRRPMSAGAGLSGARAVGPRPGTPSDGPRSNLSPICTGPVHLFSHGFPGNGTTNLGTFKQC
eukprot:Cvel_18066.t1-p1 / transcript=Cvel_18066.t1 / gene=Cvel_18066 / organism=Chromera_velia_CCMP2878 / gene_product=hypothetical protein / transcript_product=hypothetical protein / location=Cvel_scaffold1477:19316-21094(+) / protein_length=593 / sequence_SO=supercontig / SO=protein_coding / is_pseudo=false